MQVKVILIFIFFQMPILASQNGPYLIFNENRDGPMLPFHYYMNGAFDVIQNPEWFSQDHYFEKHQIVYDRIKNPDYSIRKDGGYKKLFQDEFFSDRVVPNVGLHTLGSSYDAYWLNEYFTHYNYPIPRVWTFLATYATHLGNEALETTSSEITSHDHIADLLFFDLLGYGLGQSSNIISFFREELGMRAWHSQAIWNVKNDDIFNPGLNYIYRPSILKFSNYAPIIFTGMQNMIGISKMSANVNHSFLMGIAYTNPLKQKGRFVIGYFFERLDELLFSLQLNSSEDMSYKLNFYPGLFREHIKNVGLFLGKYRKDDYLAGLNYIIPFGISF